MVDSATQVWNTCGYVRLSREDGDKEESNSVTGQKNLIRDYLSCHSELHECAMKVDDGYTGSNFERPAFKEMIADVKAGKINCIVDKDLSRFGRDYLGSGEYIERIFPFLGVRFIAINDSYDSLHRNPASDDLVVPFKNLINEAYCRDASIKTRSQLEIKRRRGDFIGAFAAFGYRKAPQDHHKLLVDDYAAGVVRDIFQWKMEGIGTGDIADRLNKAGVPTPMEYKKAQGLNYRTSFRVKVETAWSVKMILRILKNRVYTGVLEQGRITTPNYKNKRVVLKPQDEWAVIEGNHEAIIDPLDYEIIQKVLSLDTRTCEAGKAVEPLAGLLFCGECGGPMVRRTVKSDNNKYVYYICAAHKNEKLCFSHSIRDTDLEGVVLTALNQRIRDVINLSDMLKMAGTAELQRAYIKKLNDRLLQKQKEIDRYSKLLCSLYESLSDDLIDREEYLDLKRAYTRRRTEAEKQAETIRGNMSAELCRNTGAQLWMEAFCKRGTLETLDRMIAVTLIESVNIYRDRRVELIFRWHNEFIAQLEPLKRAHEQSSERRAI